MYPPRVDGTPQEDVNEDVSIIDGGSGVEGSSKVASAQVNFVYIREAYPGMVGSTVSAPAME